MASRPAQREPFNKQAVVFTCSLYLPKGNVVGKHTVCRLDVSTFTRFVVCKYIFPIYRMTCVFMCMSKVEVTCQMTLPEKSKAE